MIRQHIDFKVRFIEPLYSFGMTQAEVDDIKSQRSTFIPGINGSDNVVRREGDIFRLTGLNAEYLRNLINKGIIVDIIVWEACDTDTCKPFDSGWSSGFGGRYVK